jgi:uncharacterized membrane-anchored protein
VEQPLSKTARVTLIFWIIKIAATILGKTGGDAVTMSMHPGYLAGTAVFAAISVVADHSHALHPFLHQIRSALSCQLYDFAFPVQIRYCIGGS